MIENVDIKECSITFILSTPTVDRAEDIVLPESISLKSHQKLPYLCFNHVRQYPMGRCEDPTTNEYLLKWTPDGLIGKAYFNQKDYDAMWIFSRVCDGVLRGMSPGFIRKSFKPNPDSKRGGLIYVAGEGSKANELLEATVCVNGENPDAMITLVEKNLKEDKPSDWIQKEFAKIYEKKVVTVATTIVNKSSDSKDPNQKAEEKDSPPGHKALKALHEHYVKGKALIAKHLPAQEKESPVHEHLSAVDKAYDEMMETNKTLHDERYAEEHGELEENPGSAEEVGKELKDLILIKKAFKDYETKYAKLEKDHRELLKKIK